MVLTISNITLTETTLRTFYRPNRIPESPKSINNVDFNYSEPPSLIMEDTEDELYGSPKYVEDLWTGKNTTYWLNNNNDELFLMVEANSNDTTHSGNMVIKVEYNDYYSSKIPITSDTLSSTYIAITAVGYLLVLILLIAIAIMVCWYRRAKQQAHQTVYSRVSLNKSGQISDYTDTSG